MESNYIQIIENLPLISVIMPYYGYTHRAFLVLSELSKRSRTALIKNYKIFRRIMLKFSMVMEISIQDLEELIIPLDMFKCKIDEFSSENEILSLLKFVNTFKNKISIFMHTFK